MAISKEQSVLTVDGMSCQSCVRHVEGALRKLEGVSNVEVRLQEGKVVVEHDGRSKADMVAALQAAGYVSRLGP